MKVLFTGKGSSGSWQCRGIQLGGQIGKAKPYATPHDCAEADLIVVVKRLHPAFMGNIRASGKPWIWDLVDFYPQPMCGKWDKDQAIAWVRREIMKAKPDGIIYPNKAMRQDIQIPGAVIYHHARPDAPINPIREKISVVGYEGSPRFLGVWEKALRHECKRRGWHFSMTAEHHELDVVVAFRDGLDNGYCQRMWKSNVKLANAHATGTPFIGQTDCSYIETGTGYEMFINLPDKLSKAFDKLEDQQTRKEVSEAFLKNTYTLQSRADQLRAYLEALL